MRTRVVLRTDLKNVEIIFNKSELNSDFREILLTNIKGFVDNVTTGINKQFDSLFRFMKYIELDTGTIYLDMPSEVTYYHKIDDKGCNNPDCDGTCNVCSLEWCSICGKSEVDMRYHCSGKDIKLEDRHSYKGGLVLENIPYLDWLFVNDLSSGGNYNYYDYYTLEQSVAYIIELKNTYLDYNDFLLSPFLLEELIQLVPFIEDINKYHPKLGEEVYNNYLEHRKYLIKIIKDYKTLQAGILSISPEDRAKYSIFVLSDKKIHMSEKHNILTKSNYEDSTIDTDMVEWIKYLNANNLETTYCCQGHSNKNHAYVRFHPTIKQDDIVKYWNKLGNTCLKLYGFDIRKFLKLSSEHIATTVYSSVQVHTLSYKYGPKLIKYLSIINEIDLMEESWEMITKLMLDLIVKLSNHKEGGLAIRKINKVIEDRFFLENDTFSKAQLRKIKNAVSDYYTIIVGGIVGSGKTTMINYIKQEGGRFPTETSLYNDKVLEKNMTYEEFEKINVSDFEDKSLVIYIERLPNGNRKGYVK